MLAPALADPDPVGFRRTRRSPQPRRRAGRRHRDRLGAAYPRAVILDEGCRSGSLAAEISARITEKAFYDLDAPAARVCSIEAPVPYARHLEQAALPQPEQVVSAAQGM
jgi:hypothetical protein